jgi:tRNA/tmRNA/rRNA uracil-C5-methylase (TrmA/RlmC/RlmD family)
VKPASSSPAVALRADKLVGGGRALGHAQGTAWMVRGALPGELVRAVPSRRRGKIVEADLVEIVEAPHPARIADPCPHAPACGGCDWPHVEPAAGAHLKVEVAAEAAGRGSDLADVLRAAAVVPSEPSYRHRVRLHWDPATSTLGFFEQRSWRVADIPHCRIVTPELAELRPVVARALTGRCGEPVDVELLSGSDGVVAALRPGPHGRGPISADQLPSSEACPGLAGFHRLTSGSRLLPGWGRTAVTMDLPIALEVPVGAFFQGNAHLADVLFRRVGSLVGSGSAPVFDLHGGVGYLAAAAHHSGRRLITVVEPHPGAAEAARTNLPAAAVHPTSAEDFVDAADALPRDAVVMVDPPRAGLTRRLRSQLAAWRPTRIVSLGCDPATWSRDVTELRSSGYDPVHVELVDLFPFTHHVEIVAVLETG